jgi:hypothetical protein
VKPFLTGEFFHSIIDSIKEQVVSNQSESNSFFSSIFRRYYRYIITSIDYILYKNRPYVIDLNGIVSTLRYLQKLKKKYLDSFFKNFISQIALENNEETLKEQKLHLIIVNQFYYAIQKLGPSYISGERYINLDTLEERSLKDIIEELLLKKEINQN